MADDRGSGSNAGLWGLSAAALGVALVASGVGWKQASQLTTLQQDVTDLTVQVKKLQQAKPQPALARAPADRMAAAKAKAKAKGGAPGAPARPGPVDVEKRLDAFISKNEIPSDKGQGLKDIHEETLTNLRKLGQDVKAGTLKPEERQTKMLAELKRRNESVVALLGDELGGKAVKLLSMSSKQSSGQAKARQARPNSRLPQ